MKKTLIICTVLISLLTTGCIKENLDDCYSTLYFSYLGDGTTEIFQQKTGKVNLYVYNEGGTLVQDIVLEKSDLRKQQGVTLNLPSGKYRVVCWGNPYGDTDIENTSSINTGIVAAKAYFRREVVTTNDSLYYGARDIDVLQDINHTDTVRFVSAHIKMLIDLRGLEDLKEADGSSPLSIEMTNLSPSVNFSDQFSTNNETYYPIERFDDATKDFRARFNVLRFNDDNDIYINLTNKETDTVIYSMPLKDFMIKNNITVNGINEILIGIRFIFNGTSITVAPWDEEVIIPGYNT